MPRSSKKRMTTDCGSSGLRRTVRPARLPRDAHVVAGHRHRGQLEVGHVHADRVAPDHERALEHPGGAARVARGRDVRALLEARRPRLGQAHGQLGADVDVGDALHALAAEERAGAAGLPDDGGVDLRAGLDHLVGVDLDVAAHLGVARRSGSPRPPRRRARTRAPLRRSQERPSTAPSTRARRAEVGVLADHRALAARRARPPACWRRWSCRRPTTASASMVQFSPMNAGRRRCAPSGSIEEPLPDPDARAQLEAATRPPRPCRRGCPRAP